MGLVSRAPTATHLAEVQLAALAESMVPPPAGAIRGHADVAAKASNSPRVSRDSAAVAFEVLRSGMPL